MTTIINLLLIAFSFHNSLINSINIANPLNYKTIQETEYEFGECDTKELRDVYILSYNRIDILDTTFKDFDGKIIKVVTRYYCLFDSSLFVPKQYFWEDSTKNFLTHNFAHDIKIIIDKDTIFNKTIYKSYFKDMLNSELQSYAVILYPEFHYDKKEYLFNISYSISIPITDIGVGFNLLIDKKGKATIID